MSLMYLRTTLLHSNPAVIRYFQMDSLQTTSNLLYAIAILHGWENVPNMFSASEESGHPMALKSEEILEELFETRKSLQLSVKDTEFVFRLEYMGRSEDNDSQEDEISLLRWRGLNPRYECSKIAVWNKLHQELISSGESFDHRYGYCSLKDWIPDPDSMNRKLERQIVQGEAEVHIHYECSRPCRAILTDKSVNGLKQMIRDRGLGLPYNMRKDELVEMLTDYFCDDDFWDHILRSMSWKEYDLFKRSVQGQESDGRKQLPTLDDYLLIANSRAAVNYYGFNEYLPKELLSYYEEMWNDGRLEVMEKRKKISVVLKACGEYYVMFDREQLNSAAETMFPGELGNQDFKRSDMKAAGIGVTEGGILFADSYILAEDAAAIFSHMKREIPIYHTPSSEILCDFAESSMKFPQPHQSKILQAISEVFRCREWSNQAEQIARELYMALHFGYEEDGIQEHIRRNGGAYGKTGNVQRLVNLIMQAKPDVPLVDLRGFSENEWKSYRKQAQESVKTAVKIYPNDPCPCGSGKKYKKCCGRGRV